MSQPSILTSLPSLPTSKLIEKGNKQAKSTMKTAKWLLRKRKKSLATASLTGDTTTTTSMNNNNNNNNNKSNSTGDDAFTVKSSVSSELEYLQRVDSQMPDDDDDDDDDDDSSRRRLLVSIVKQNASSYCGLTIRQDCHNNNNKHIFVNYIGDHGLFATTLLQVGDRIISVNGHFSPEAIVDCLKHDSGRITVEAIQGNYYDYDDYYLSASSSEESSSSTTATTTAPIKTTMTRIPQHGRVILEVQKAKRHCKFGISIQGDEKVNGSVYITHAKKDGSNSSGLLGTLLGDIVPQQGTLRVDSLNGVPCSSRPADLVRRLKSVFPMFVLECTFFEAKQQQQPKQQHSLSFSNKERQHEKKKKTTKVPVVIDEDTIVVATIHKPSPDAKVGISLRQSGVNLVNSVLICTIAANGLLACSNSGLRVGQKVLRINGAPCPEDAIEAANLIGNTTQTLTIEAADVDWGATFGSDDGDGEERDNNNNNNKNVGGASLAAGADDDEEAELTRRMMVQSIHSDDEEDDDHDAGLRVDQSMAATIRNSASPSERRDDEFDLLDDIMKDLQEDMSEANHLLSEFTHSNGEEAEEQHAALTF